MHINEGKGKIALFYTANNVLLTPLLFTILLFSFNNFFYSHFSFLLLLISIVFPPPPPPPHHHHHRHHISKTKYHINCGLTLSLSLIFFFLQNYFKMSPKGKLRLFPPTKKTCLNQDVAGCKTFLQKGVTELLSKTCNSVICLRAV